MVPLQVDQICRWRRARTQRKSARMGTVGKSQFPRGKANGTIDRLTPAPSPNLFRHQPQQPSQRLHTCTRAANISTPKTKVHDETKCRHIPHTFDTTNPIQRRAYSPTDYFQNEWNNKEPPSSPPTTESPSNNELSLRGQVQANLERAG